MCDARHLDGRRMSAIQVADHFSGLPLDIPTLSTRAYGEPPPCGERSSRNDHERFRGSRAVVPRTKEVGPHLVEGSIPQLDSQMRWTRWMSRSGYGALGGLLLLLAMPSAVGATGPTCMGLRATVVGTDGADRLEGTSGADVIVGGGGDDHIVGHAGDDVICGGPGDDVVLGGTGSDRLVGGRGRDTLRGGGGADHVHGGRNGDRLMGGPGPDVLDGAAGNDRVNGGAGDDLLRSGVGNDRLIGGSGTDELAGSGRVLGTTGDIRTFAVTVEAGTGLDQLDVAANVERILGDPRGWSASGRRFQRVDAGGASINVLIASPATVDARCAPLRTNGWLSCRRGSSVFLNVNRWNEAVPHWGSTISEYRAYLVNHEVGHVLGHGHVSCPGAGSPAPVMQQQTKSLQGCEPNGWPFNRT